MAQGLAKPIDLSVPGDLTLRVIASFLQHVGSIAVNARFGRYLGPNLGLLTALDTVKLNPLKRLLRENIGSKHLSVALSYPKPCHH